jgi:hypothetical protein
VPICLLVIIGVFRRIQIARTRRELERMGFVVRVPYASRTRPSWPRLAAGFATAVALIVATAALSTAPLARTQASSVGAPFHSAPIDGAVIAPSTSPGPGHAATHATASPSVTSPAPPSQPASQTSDAGGGSSGAPSAVSALSTSATTIQLDWTSVNGADSYRVERSADTVHWKHLASTPGTRYTDEELTSGTTYYYRVIPTVDDQDLATSDVVSATTTVDIPTAPAPVSATASATSVDLQWGDVDGETGYRMERSSDGTSDWTQIGTTAQDITSFTDTGLVYGTTYYYRVIAWDSAGESPPSTPAPATTGPDTQSASGAPVATAEG